MTTETKTQSLPESTSGNFGIYHLLAGVFKDVASADFLTVLKGPQLLGILEDVGCRFDDDFLLTTVGSDLLESLAVDFTQLFIGPTEFISPYESMFHERGDNDWGKLWGADTILVKKFIESSGLDFTNDYGGIPDHLCVELEFIGRVSEKIDEAMINKQYKDALYFLKMKKLFFDDHLTQWIPAFCAKGAAKATTSFYREIITFLDNFITMEHEEIPGEIQTVEGKIKL